MAEATMPRMRVKGSGSYAPPPQRTRIREKYAQGKRIQTIAREEKMCWVSVAKIVRSAEADAYMEEKRAEFRGLADDALANVRRALHQAMDDGKLGFEILKALGIAPSAVNKYQLELQKNQAANISDDEQTKNYMQKLALVAMDRNKIYGTTLPEFEPHEGNSQKELVMEPVEENDENQNKE